MTSTESPTGRPATPPVAVLLAAIALGVLADVLFRSQSLGLNAFIWTAVLCVVLGALSLKSGSWRTEGTWLVMPSLLFAAAIAWRASPVLQAMNVAAIVLILAVASFRLQGGRVRIGSVTEYAWAAGRFLWVSLAGLVLITVRLPWRGLSGGWRVPAVARGAAFAVPLVLLFGALFASADAVFAGLLLGAVSVDIGSVASHTIWVLAWSWVAAGVMKSLLAGTARPAPSVQPPPFLRLGTFEVSTALGLLDLLFLGFLAVQLRSLFGGADYVEASTSLTYAEYARQGFFQLLAVAALVLPVILVVHWLLRDSSANVRLAFRVLAATLILSLFAVIASALQRMHAYVDEFGLTQLRFYATAIMVVLACVFVWLALTVLRERRRQFAFGAVLAGLGGLFVLNLANPDALIVKTNLGRASEGRPFDADYAVSLSADATPTVIAGLSRLDADSRCETARLLLTVDVEDEAWQSWNWSRAHAENALRENAEALRNACP